MKAGQEAFKVIALEIRCDFKNHKWNVCLLTTSLEHTNISTKKLNKKCIYQTFYQGKLINSIGSESQRQDISDGCQTNCIDSKKNYLVCDKNIREPPIYLVALLLITN